MNKCIDAKYFSWKQHNEPEKIYPVLENLKISYHYQKHQYFQSWNGSVTVLG